MPSGYPRQRRTRRDAGSEASFQDQVVALARIYGWREYHTHDSRRSAPGFPDLVLLRPPRLVFAELKTETGRLRPKQREWLEELRQVADALGTNLDSAAAIEVYTWRPADLQAIAELLAGNDIDPEIGRAWAAERSRVDPVKAPARHRKTLGRMGDT